MADRELQQGVDKGSGSGPGAANALFGQPGKPGPVTASASSVPVVFATQAGGLVGSPLSPSDPDAQSGRVTGSRVTGGRSINRIATKPGLAKGRTSGAP